MENQLETGSCRALLGFCREPREGKTQVISREFPVGT